MSSFLSIISAPAVRQVAEKGLFGKPFVRLGKLFGIIGFWVYQQGGALGYGLRDEPELLGRILGHVPSPAAEYFCSLRETIAAVLAEVKGQKKTFFHLYTLRELRELGIDLTEWPPSKALNKKVGEEFASDVMRISFHEGAALGYNFPETFTEYWEQTYRVLPDKKWKEMRARGLVLSEIQQKRPLETAVAELAEAARAWATEETPGLLDAYDIKVLNGLIARANDIN